MKKRVYYNTYISIIRNNEYVSFAAGVSYREIEEELIKVFIDLAIPLDLLDDCMYDGMLSYEGTYVYIIDVTYGVDFI